jgi:CRP-like cAMP-binding protein
MTNSQNKKHCIDCFDINELLGALTNDEKAEIKKHEVEVRFKKGEIICKQGTFASNIAFIKKGLVKIFLEHNERNLILKIEPAGKLIGLQSLYSSYYHYTCVAYEDSLICLFDIAYFKQLIQENAIFASQIINALSENTIANYERLTCLTQKKSHGRLADILLCLSEKIYKSNVFKFHFPRKDLAELSNMSVENLTRTINDLKKDKIISISGNNIEILNLEKLKTISEKG